MYFNPTALLKEKQKKYDKNNAILNLCRTTSHSMYRMQGKVFTIFKKYDKTDCGMTTYAYLFVMYSQL